MNEYRMAGYLLCAPLLAISQLAMAEIAVPVEGLEADVIGFAIGSAPDYYGSADRAGAFGPYGRYQLKGSERYVLLLGPQLSMNVLDHANWRAGPLLRYRSARDSDVENAVVSRMDEIDAAMEAGVFLEYKLPLSQTPFHQIVLGGDVETSSNGSEAHLKAMYWQPLSRKLVMSAGIGMTYASDEFSETYFGVTSAHDIALYPGLAGNAYEASGGVVGWNIPFALNAFLTDEWLLSVGGRFEKLTGDAQDSPIVQQHGSDTQWVAGAGISYILK